MRHLGLFVAFWMSATPFLAAQVGIGTTVPDNSAILELLATDRGFLPPRVTTAQRDAINGGAPADGLLIYNTDSAKLEWYDGVALAWQTLYSTDASALGGSGTLDDAYNFGGPGAGRSIAATAGAVEIAGTDGLLVTGTSGSGVGIGTLGPGTWMFFNPRNAAFRAGEVTGTQWDEPNVGFYSTALGLDNSAESLGATAWGVQNAATGERSTAWGDNNTASGSEATVWGEGNRAFSFAETVFGTYATSYAPASTVGFDPDDRLLTVGNGPDAANRSDALVILKSGNVGIGTADPQVSLEIVGETTSSGDLRLINASDGFRPSLDFFRSRGSLAAPTNVQDGTLLGEISFEGYAGSNYVKSSGISSIVEGTVSPGNVPSALVFSTEVEGGGFDERMRLDNAGNLGIGTTNPQHRLEVEGEGQADDFTDLLRLSIFPATGPADIGFGSGLVFEAEDAGGTRVDGAAIRHLLADEATSESELRFYVKDFTASLPEVARLNGAGALEVFSTVQAGYSGTSAGRMQLVGGVGNNQAVSLLPNATMAASYDLVLPGNPGNAGDVLGAVSPGVLDWVDPSTFGSGFSASENGLTDDGTTVKLGGPLTETTTIDAAAFQLFYRNGNMFFGNGVDSMAVQPGGLFGGPGAPLTLAAGTGQPGAPVAGNLFLRGGDLSTGGTAAGRVEIQGGVVAPGAVGNGAPVWVQGGEGNPLSGTGGDVVLAGGFGDISGNVLLAWDPIGLLPRGNVGIGTGAPANPLEVQANLTGFAARIENSSTGTAGGLTINTAGTSNALALRRTGNTGSVAFLTINEVNNGSTAPIISATNAGTGDFIRYVQSVTPIFAIDNLGNIGIGTTTPNEAISISRDGTAIGGAMVFERIKRTGVGAEFGADIRFELDDDGGNPVEAMALRGGFSDPVNGTGAFSLLTANLSGNLVSAIRSEEGRIILGDDGRGGELALYNDQVGVDQQLVLAPNAAMASTYQLVFPPDQGANGQVLLNDGAGNLTWGTPSGTTQWNDNGNGIDYTAGNVGIGTTAPQKLLQITNFSTEAGILIEGPGGSGFTTNVTANPTTTGAQIGGGLNPNWTNTDQVFSLDGSAAEVLTGVGIDSKTLPITGFGFSIPNGATITGVSVNITRRADVNNGIRDKLVQLVLGGVPTGSNLALTGPGTDWPNTFTTFSYGGISETWGNVLTPAAVNAPDFGVAVQVNNQSLGLRTSFIDRVAVVVYYTTTAGAQYAVGVGSVDGGLFKIATGSDLANDDFVLDQSGNVGIGTATPAATLDVQGDFQLGSSQIVNRIVTNLAAPSDVQLPTALAVANAISAAAGIGAAANGLTDNAGTVELGGALVQPTNIDMGNFDLNFLVSGAGAFSVTDGSDNLLITPSSLQQTNPTGPFSIVGPLGSGLGMAGSGQLELFAGASVTAGADMNLRGGDATAGDGGNLALLAGFGAGPASVGGSIVIRPGGGNSAGNIILAEDGAGNPRGNVGIGTATPTARLHVEGEFRLENGTAVAGIQTTMTGFEASDNDLLTAKAINDAIAANSGLWEDLDANNQINYAGGNVGIGTETATARLEVRGPTRIGVETASQPVFVVEGSAGGAGVVDAEQLSTGFGNGMIWQSFTPTVSGFLTQIDFRTNGGGAQTVTVYEGQGTGGAVLTSFGFTFPFSNTLNAMPLPTPVFVQAGTEYSFGVTGNMFSSFAGGDPYPGGRRWSSPSEDAVFRTYIAPVGDGFLVEATGNVGIGTNAPNALLDVNGDFRLGTTQPVTGIQTTMAGFEASDNDLLTAKAINDAITAASGTVSTTDRITGDGSPGSPLDLEVLGITPLPPTSISPTGFEIPVYTFDEYGRFDSYGASLLYTADMDPFDDVLNVLAGSGINVVTAGQNRTVEADFANPIWNANALRGNPIENAVPANGDFLRFDGTEWGPVGVPTGKWLDAGSPANSIYYDNGGNVGIGINTPTNGRLHINNISGGNAAFIAATYAGAAATRGLEVQSVLAGTSANDHYGIRTSLTDATSNVSGDLYGVTAEVAGPGTGTKYAFYADLGGSTGTSYGIYTESEAFNYFSGNVGIGTSSPARPLDILNTLGNGGIGVSTATGASATAANTAIQVDMSQAGTGGITALNFFTNTGTASSVTFLNGFLELPAAKTGTNYGLNLQYDSNTAGTDYGVFVDNEDFNYFSGNVGIGTISTPNVKLLLDEDYATNNTPETMLRLVRRANLSIGDDNIGAAIDFDLENLLGSTADAGQLVFDFANASGGDEEGRFRVNMNYRGTGLLRSMELFEGTLTLGSNGIINDGRLRLYAEQGAQDYELGFQPNAAMTENVFLVFPPDEGAPGQVLATDGAGNLSWANGGGGSLWTDDSPNIYYNVLGGNVGIGTIAPTEALDVNGNIRAFDLPGTPLGSSVALSSPGNNPGLAITRGDGFGNPFQTFTVFVTPGGALRFRDATAGEERISINSGLGGGVAVGNSGVANSTFQVNGSFGTSITRFNPVSPTNFDFTSPTSPNWARVVLMDGFASSSTIELPPANQVDGRIVTFKRTNNIGHTFNFVAIAGSIEPQAIGGSFGSTQAYSFPAGPGAVTFVADGVANTWRVLSIRD